MAKSSSKGENLPRGGLHQRLQGEIGDRGPTPSSQLCRMSLEKWAHGHLSPQEVQEMMELHRKDIANAVERTLRDGAAFSYKEVDKISSIGAEGGLSQNCRRDLEQNLKPYLFHQPEMIRVPMADNTAEGASLYAQRFHMPYNTLPDIYHHYPGAWKKTYLS